MIDSVRNLYTTPDLPNGEFLLKPLKAYDQFFAKKIKNSTGLINIVIKIINIITGLFAYPFFGLFAGVGMFVKLTGVPTIKSHNEVPKTSVKLIQKVINGELSPKDFVAKGPSSIGDQPASQIVKRDVFEMSKVNAEAKTQEILLLIDSLTEQFRKVHLNAREIEQYGREEIHITISHFA